MGTYAVTGSASGMGAAVRRKLLDAGHSVIGVDLKDADVVADLSTPAGRTSAATTVLELAANRLDGAVLAAGLGPTAGLERARLITQVNYFGVVDLLTAWRPALASTGGAKVVVFSSNSTTTVPMVPASMVRAFLAHDADKAFRIAKRFRKYAPPFAYAASKIAVARWVRRSAVTSDWAGAGIRLNAIAPGAIMTPMLEGQLATSSERSQIESFPVPIGHFGDPSHLGDWVVFMLSPAAEFLVGSVVFVDGGTDAYFRADDWPRTIPLSGAPAYFKRMRAWAARRKRG
jgi:NAD(P)-dependent dehydrogenase (short-subunit alcohol dehydrogenase family)